jgi:hypothetical protein
MSDGILTVSQTPWCRRKACASVSLSDSRIFTNTSGELISSVRLIL